MGNGVGSKGGRFGITLPATATGGGASRGESGPGGSGVLLATSVTCWLYFLEPISLRLEMLHGFGDGLHRSASLDPLVAHGGLGVSHVAKLCSVDWCGVVRRC